MQNNKQNWSSENTKRISIVLKIFKDEPLSQDEIDQGLKDAMSEGNDKAIQELQDYVLKHKKGA